MPKDEQSLAILRDRSGRNVALKNVTVHARIHGLIAEVEVEQTYKNSQAENIEAIYMFPLSIGAVLLGLEVEFSGKKLLGTVVERKVAERSYEDAITDGDSAVMLQEAGPGLYAASIGNLMANESAVVRYRYGLMLSWQGPKLRFLLPTAIAPRYGDAIAAGLQPHQALESTLDVEYPLNLTIDIEGELAVAKIASPTHSITARPIESGISVRLAEKAVLDRDFVLNIESASAQSSCVETEDGEGRVVAASLRIPPIQDTVEKPLSLRIVIDCSGSMAGTSIAQARKASLEILNLLRPKDRFNITLFGSSCRHVFRKSVLASTKNITKAWNHLEGLEADMGGTEMGNALKSTFALSTPDEQSAVLLITDGEIHQHENVIQLAKASQHRVFTVGVGNAVSEAFLKSLSRETGGACELAAPQEGVCEKILNQFHRFRQPQLEELHIVWPSEPVWTTALPVTAFAGDTVHVFAGFDKPLAGQLVLHASAGGETFDISSPIVPREELELPRIAAAKRVETATETQGLELSLDYQLLSRWTSYLVIAERETKANDLPALHQVPQMLAAGWGGIGQTPSALQRANSKNKVLKSCSFEDFDDDVEPDLPPEHDQLSADSTELNLLATSESENRHLTPQEFIARMEAGVGKFGSFSDLPSTIRAIRDCGISSCWAVFLLFTKNRGHDEEKVITAFLYALSESSIGDCFERSIKRLVLKKWKDTGRDEQLSNLILNELATIDAENWNIPDYKAIDRVDSSKQIAAIEPEKLLDDFEIEPCKVEEPRKTFVRSIWAFVAFNVYSLLLTLAFRVNVPFLFDAKEMQEMSAAGVPFELVSWGWNDHYIWRLFSGVVVSGSAAFLAGAIARSNGSRLAALANIPSICVWVFEIYLVSMDIAKGEPRIGYIVASVIAIPLTTWVAFQYGRLGEETQASDFKDDSVFGIRPFHWAWISIPLFVYADGSIFVIVKFFSLLFSSGVGVFNGGGIRHALVIALTLIPVVAWIYPVTMAYEILRGRSLPESSPVTRLVTTAGVIVGGVMLASATQSICLLLTNGL